MPKNRDSALPMSAGLELEVLDEEMLEGHPCSRAMLVAASSSAPVSLPSFTRPSYLRLGLHQSMAPLRKGHRKRLPEPLIPPRRWPKRPRHSGS
jgi:hypothetical protein